MVEDALVRLGMVAMEITEGASEEDERVFEVWSHFASQLVFSYFLQLVSITAVLNKLRSKVATGRPVISSDCCHVIIFPLVHSYPTVVIERGGAG